jgi:rubrerythrin
MYETDTNLQSAFASESQAYLRYTFFAQKAQSDGLPALAKLFSAAAEAELVHARNHFTVMGGLGTTKSNLLAAATSEQNAVSSIYPAFIYQAKSDRNESARITFEYALQAEKGHNEIFEKALRTFKDGQPIVMEKYFCCSVCGNLFSGSAPIKCNVCGNTAEKIKEI